MSTNERTCEQCQQPMTGRADKKYCSAKCRVAAHRASGPRSMSDAEMADGAWTAAKEMRSPEVLWFMTERMTAEGRGLIRDQIRMSLEAVAALDVTVTDDETEDAPWSAPQAPSKRAKATERLGVQLYTAAMMKTHLMLVHGTDGPEDDLSLLLPKIDDAIAGLTEARDWITRNW